MKRLLLLLIFAIFGALPSFAQCGTLTLNPITEKLDCIGSNSGGSGTVTSVTIAGTTNQIAATGTCTGTTVITCTLSIPPGLVLPGTIDGLTITTTTGTLTITGAKVLTVSNSLTLAGTDGVTITFPATNATIARTDAAQTLNGIQTFSSPPVMSGASITAASIPNSALVNPATTVSGQTCTLGSSCTVPGVNTTFSVSESAGAYTCNFSNGNICLVTIVSANGLITPTLTNLPSNQVIYIIHDTKTNSRNGFTTAWPTSSPAVYCTIGDTPTTCGTVNGFSQTSTKFVNAFWSDGTNLFTLPGQFGSQTLNTSHVNVPLLEVFNTNTLGAGTLEFLFGSTIQSNASGTPALNATSCSGAAAGTMTNQTGLITSLPTGGCTLILTWAGTLGTAPHGWGCALSNMTHPGPTNMFTVSGYTTSTISFTGTSVSGDELLYSGCMGF